MNLKKLNFSIIVPIYNKEKYLKRCLNSILADEKDDYEVITINDGSTDNSLCILNSYPQNTKIRIYSQENIGANKTRLKGISLAKGKYIIFVDADDTITSNLLPKLRLSISNNPDIIKYNINEIYSTKDKKRYQMTKESVLTGEQVLYEWNNDTTIRYGLYGMYCFKNKFIQKHLNCFNDYPYYEDICSITKLLYFADIVNILDFVGYNYYRHPDSQTNKNFFKKYQTFIEVVNDINDFFLAKEGNNSKLCQVINEYYKYHLKRKRKELDYSK